LLPQSQREERAELEPLLEIADELARVGTMLPAPSFANDLEARLLARAGWQALGADAHASGPTLVALAPPTGDGQIRDHGEARDEARDEASDEATVPLLALTDKSDRADRTERSRRGAPGRVHSQRQVSWRVWSSLAAAILLALTITTFAVAANASPGSAFYGVRRWQEDARTNLANSDAERTQLHIQYATDALDALDAAVAQHAATGVYAEALGRFSDEFGQATAALALVPAGSDHDALAASLDDLRVRGRSDLRAALPLLSWPARITTTSVLGGLGESVVKVTQVKGVRLSSLSGPVWIVTITGEGLQRGAILLVRQRPAGQVVSVASTQLVARLSAGRDDSLPHDIGVGNPDNTAATTAQVASEHEDDHAPNATGTPGSGHGPGECELEDHGISCTPTPTSTPQH
jgi:hypothetical protein